MSSWWEKYYRRGKWGKKTLPPSKPVLDLKEMLAKLSRVQDEQWGRYAFRRELLRDKFDEERRRVYTRRANECGAEYAEKIAAGHNSRDPETLAGALGGKVTYPRRREGGYGGGRILFAQFTEPDKIEIFSDCTEKAGSAVLEHGLERYFTEGSVKNILLAHELFHLVELAYRDTIFTRTEKIDLLPLKIIHNWSAIRCLSEMAGMRFAKELCGLPFSPYILDVFLLYLYDAQKASDLYRAIMKILFPGQNEED